MLEIIESIQNPNFNKTLIERLIHEGYWKLALDQNYHKNDTMKDHSDTGMVFTSFSGLQHNDKTDIRNQFFNICGEIIFNSVLLNSGTKFTEISLRRLMWNYYNTASTGVEHLDYTGIDWYSIVYNLNESDGGTMIGDQFIIGKESRAVMFQSNRPHRGVGPKNVPYRFALNIIFTGKIIDKKNVSD